MKIFFIKKIKIKIKNRNNNSRYKKGICLILEICKRGEPINL